MANDPNELAHLKCDHCGYQRSIMRRNLSSIGAPKCGTCHQGVLRQELGGSARREATDRVLYADYTDPPNAKVNGLSIFASMATVAGVGVVCWFVLQALRRYPINIYALFAIFSLLLTVAVLKKRQLERRFDGGEPTVGGPYLSFLKGSLEFLIPFTATAFIYSILQCWVTHLYSSVDHESSLRVIEEAIRSMRVYYVVPVKLSDFHQWLVIVGVVILGLLLPRVKQWNLPDKFKAGFFAVNRIYIFITLLASFTFFGNHVDKVTMEYEVQLNRQIDDVKNSYSEYQTVVEDAVRQVVAEEIVNHPEFKDVYDEIKLIAQDAAHNHQEVQSLYSFVSANWYLDKTQVDALNRDLTSRFPDGGNGPSPPKPPRDKPSPAAPQVMGSKHNTSPGGGGATSATPETPADLTLESVNALLEEAKKLKREGAKTKGRLSEVIAKTVDVITDDLLKPLVLDLIADPAVKNQLDILLDDDVLYNFNDVIAEAVENTLRATVERAQSLREAIKTQRIAIRAKVGDNVRAAASRWKVAVAKVTFALKEIGQRMVRVKSSLSAQVGRAEYLANDLLKVETEGEWGSLRAEAYRQLNTRATEAGSPQRGMALIVEEWAAWRDKKALELASKGRNLRDITPDAWDRLFFNYCQENPQMAVIWGWVVKDLKHDEVLMRFGRAIPEFGFVYFVEQSGLGDRAVVRELFSTDVAELTIEEFCN